MAAWQVEMEELYPPRRPNPLVTLGVQIALLQDDLDRFSATWRELVEHPDRWVSTPFDEEGS